MNIVWVICKREVKFFFTSLIAYIVLILFLGLSGFFTWLFGNNDIFFWGQASLQVFFQMAFWTLFFFIPAVTMRMIAEEKKEGTLEWLVTKPLSDEQIILGKWLASWFLILLSLALTLPYYITISNIGPIDHGATLSGYIALMMIGGLYTSIGIFASSLTNNQIVGFILSLALAFIFHFALGIISETMPYGIANVLNFLSIEWHYRTMIRGIISLSSIVYLFSLTGLFLLFASFSLKQRKW